MRARLCLAMAAALLSAILVGHAQQSQTHEWLTWGGDPERTGWNRSESLLYSSKEVIDFVTTRQTFVYTFGLKK